MISSCVKLEILSSAERAFEHLDSVLRNQSKPILWSTVVLYASAHGGRLVVNPNKYQCLPRKIAL